MDRVSDRDRDNLKQLWANGRPTFTRDLQAEANFFQPNVNLEVENNDALKGSIFSFKFLGFNTPSSLPPTLEALPKSLFFVFKFYTFDALQTDPVQLSTTGSIEEGKLNPGKIELAKRYHLVQQDQFRQFTQNKPVVEQILDRGLAIPFEVSALRTREATEHEKFAKYLKEQVLTIDLFNGADQTHFGTARVPLYRLLR